MRTLSKLQPYALALLRILLAVAMLYHSWDKVYPAEGLRHAYYHHHLLLPEQTFNDFVQTLHLPRWLGYASTAAEFLGGICLLLGFLTRIAALFVAVNMLFALVLVNVRHGYTASEFSLSLLATALLLVTTGAGAPSLDRKFGIT